MAGHALPSRGGIRVSFEFFPPKNDEAEAGLWEAVERLAPLDPLFASVTYGAGGTTRERTHGTVARMVRETDIRPAAHLTCVGATREEVDAVIAKWNEHASAFKGAARGLEVTAQKSRACPGAGLALEFAYEFSVGGSALFLLLF